MSAGTAMAAGELKPCSLCRKGLIHTGVPLFWRVNIERMGIDLQKARQLAGLSMMLGSPHLASVMGDDRAIGVVIEDSRVELLVCEDCALAKSLPVAVLSEYLKP